MFTVYATCYSILHNVMISFEVPSLPENEASEAAVTCDLLPLPEEKFTIHRIE